MMYHPSRSIFSTPWMEFGDSVKIDCPSTKLSCEIKFITRGVFGGDSNTIKGQIMDKEDVIAKLSGHWTDIVDIAHVANSKKVHTPLLGFLYRNFLHHIYRHIIINLILNEFSHSFGVHTE